MENRQFGSQTPQVAQAAQALTPVRHIGQSVGNVLAIVGASLFVPGAIAFILGFFFTNQDAFLSLIISGGTLALVGAIHFIIGAAMKDRARRLQSNIDRLKVEGNSFPGEITNIVRQPHVHVGSSVSAYAECTYQNKEGKTCLVRSRMFMCKGEKYTAWVHVNPFDPTDYAVEIFTQSPHADFDYR